jgi:predicted nucleic acid-binding protein
VRPAKWRSTATLPSINWCAIIWPAWFEKPISGGRRWSVWKKSFATVKFRSAGERGSVKICMNADAPLAFVDTNVLVYALAADDARRSPRAQALLRELMSAEVFRTSTQVLQELFVTLTRKIKTPLSPPQALHYLDQIAAWPITVLDYRTMRDAIELSVTATLSFWDALVVVAAARSGAKRLYTEDLQDGRTILGVEIVNPF